jgi:hypothetical protein
VRFIAGAAGTSPITTYKYSLDGGATWTTRSPVSTLSPVIISGLVNGTTYSVSIRAVSLVSDGTASTAVSATPASVPNAPTIGTATAIAGLSATVTWTAPANGGSPITGYTINAYRSGSTAVARTGTALSSAVSGSISGLTSGTSYTFKVLAKNVIGSSALSNASTAVIARR